MYDMMGNVIAVGTLIAYPCRVRSTLYVTVGRVVGFGKAKHNGRPTLKVKRIKKALSYSYLHMQIDEGSKTVTIHNTDTVVVIREPAPVDETVKLGEP